MHRISFSWLSWSLATLVFVALFFSLGTPARAAVSASGASIPSATQIVDGQMNVWTVSSGVIYENGKTASYSANVILLLYYNGVIYQENTAKGWWSWNGSGWVAASHDPRLSTSASGTTIPSATQIVDGQMNVWTVSSGVIYENGRTAGSSASVALLLYYNGVIYQENTAKGWWSWNGSGWVAVSHDPRTSAPNAPTISFGANPDSIASGSSSTLIWSSTNATSCTASGGWSGSKGTSGTQFVSPSDSTNYTLTCTGAGGSSSANTSVSVASETNTNGHFGIKVSGNHLVDGNGNPIQLHGVNVSALEGVPYNSDPWRGEAPDFAAMKTWGINVVRFPLSEANWLGLCDQTLNVGETPAVYLSTIQTAVSQANALGMYVILDLHWIAVPNSCPGGQNAMADVAHSPTFWAQVAAAFKNNPAVMFELFNEPQGNYPPTTADWYNYVSGGLTGSQDAGTQQLLNAVRGAGATNVVLVDGLDYAATFGNNDIPGLNDQAPGFMLPTDTMNPPQLAAVQHYYQGSKFETGANVVLSKGIPIVVTEYGDDTNATSDPDTLSLYGWADVGGRASQYLTDHGQDGASFPGVSYVAWTWDWGGGWYGGQGYNNWSLIQNADGELFSPSAMGDGSTTPTAYATEVKSHYLCRAAGNPECP